MGRNCHEPLTLPTLRHVSLALSLTREGAEKSRRGVSHLRIIIRAAIGSADPSLHSSAFGISKRPRSQSAASRSDVSCGTTADPARVSVLLCTNNPPPTSSDDNFKNNQLALKHLETALPLTRQGLHITRVIFHNVQLTHDGAIPSSPNAHSFAVRR